MHAVFGLAVLQMAQTMNIHINNLKNRKLGFLVPDISSSKIFFNGFKSCDKYMSPNNNNNNNNECKKGYHIFGWRDFIEIFSTWRFVYEHTDSFVWWFDSMYSNQGNQDKNKVITFADTYMLHQGVGGNARYQSYAKVCLEKVKSLIIRDGINFTY